MIFLMLFVIYILSNTLIQIGIKQSVVSLLQLLIFCSDAIDLGLMEKPPPLLCSFLSSSTNSDCVSSVIPSKRSRRAYIGCRECLLCRIYPLAYPF